MASAPPRECSCCGTVFSPPPKGGRARFCSNACRTAASKRRKLGVDEVRPDLRSVRGGDEPVVDEPTPLAGPVYSATLVKLASVDLLDDPVALAALVLAGRIDRPGAETGAGLRALVMEHRAALADAMSRAKVAADPLERLRLVVSEKSAGA